VSFQIGDQIFLAKESEEFMILNEYMVRFRLHHPSSPCNNYDDYMRGSSRVSLHCCCNFLAVSVLIMSFQKSVIVILKIVAVGKPGRMVGKPDATQRA